jgi:16S rRNA (uracil1498-N3)-methyltransferase
MIHRFFVPTEWIKPPLVHLQGEIAHQIRSVLRMQPGHHITILDNSGIEWQVILTGIDRDSVRGQILSSQPAQGESSVQLTLYQGMLKAQKFEWVLQKGTELGVTCFVPTICQRSVVNNPADLAKKRARWERIIREAAEQSRRGKLPRLEPSLSLTGAIRQADQQASSDTLILMPWEEATGLMLKTVLKQSPASSIALFIGPEGGFTGAEAAMAKDVGAHLVKLGPRILRAETAGLAVCSAILYERGEWD